MNVKIDVYKGDGLMREDGVTYIATISGGKDSVTMCDLLLKNGYPVDYIVFNDTLNEFDEMYQYIDKVDQYFQDRYKMKITRLLPNTKRNFKTSLFRTRSRGERKGQVVGLRNPSDPFCEWRRDAKIVSFEKWAKQFQEYKVYIGVTIDETHRCDRTKNVIYPLVDDFRMSENDCKQYLVNQDMENSLYRHFNRTGCANCHYQSDKDLYMIWKHYPKHWQFFVETEKEMADKKTEFKRWFSGYRSCEDMEQMFMHKEKQGSLFDFSDEPLKDCFCKI
jgi:3'-phosphoadenosine 5'-phosphosulfate sulfotransferase (PAPS reductase)/FAD synthetase